VASLKSAASKVGGKFVVVVCFVVVVVAIVVACPSGSRDVGGSLSVVEMAVISLCPSCSIGVGLEGWLSAASQMVSTLQQRIPFHEIYKLVDGPDNEEPCMCTMCRNRVLIATGGH